MMPPETRKQSYGRLELPRKQLGLSTGGARYALLIRVSARLLIEKPVVLIAIFGYAYSMRKAMGKMRRSMTAVRAKFSI